MAKDENKSDSSTWCPYPWFNLNSNTDGSVKLCCSITENHHMRDKSKVFNFGKDDIYDIWNSKYLQAARHNLTSGVKFSHCDVCWKLEDSGIESSRMAGIRDNLHTIDKEPTYLPQSLELRLGNKCNLKCMSCWSLSSSSIYTERQTALKTRTDIPDWLAHSWRKEVDEVDGFDKQWYETKTFKNNFRAMAPKLKRLYLTGGEPTLIDENCDFLSDLLNSGNTSCAVSFTTNATVWNEKFYNYLSKFDSSEVQVSLDGFGTINEYLRHGSKWDVIERNLEKIFALPNKVRIKVFTVVGFLNSRNLADLMRFLVKKHGDRPFIHAPIILQAPGYLSTRILSEGFRLEAIERISEFLQSRDEPSGIFYKHGLYRVIDHLKFQIEDPAELSFLRDKASDYVNSLDKIRNNSHPDKEEIFTRGFSG